MCALEEKSNQNLYQISLNRELYEILTADDVENQHTKIIKKIATEALGKRLNLRRQLD